jgi:ribosomal protein L37AE/L43A
MCVVPVYNEQDTIQNVVYNAGKSCSTNTERRLLTILVAICMPTTRKPTQNRLQSSNWVCFKCLKPFASQI